MIQNMNKPSSKNNYQTGQLFDDVLFSADENDPAQRGKKITYRVRKLYEIPIERMQTDANQPRHFFDSQKLNNLAESILEKGVLQPVLFRVENGKPILVAGERRFRAARQAGLKHIPAVCVEGDASVISLIENIQREDLNPIEEAEAVAKLIQKHHYQTKDLILLLGKAKSTISEIKKVNELPGEIKNECRNSNEWSRNVLVEIAKQPTKEQMLALFRKVKEQGLKSSEVRAITRKRKQGRDTTTLMLNKITAVKKSFKKIDLSELQNEKRESFKRELVNLREEINVLLQQFDSTMQ